MEDDAAAAAGAGAPPLSAVEPMPPAGDAVNEGSAGGATVAAVEVSTSGAAYMSEPTFA